MLLNTQHKSKNIVSLTPLIDVVFIMLLFFMITSNFTQISQLEVNTSAQGGDSIDDVSRLLLTSPNTAEFNGKHFDLSDQPLLNELNDLAAKGQPLTVAALSSINVQNLVSLLDYCKSLGIQNLNIAESVSR